MKVFVVTTSYVDHLGQLRKSVCTVDENELEQYAKSREEMGYTIVSVEERK